MSGLGITWERVDEATRGGHPGSASPTRTTHRATVERLSTLTRPWVTKEKPGATYRAGTTGTPGLGWPRTPTTETVLALHGSWSGSVPTAEALQAVSGALRGLGRAAGTDPLHSPSEERCPCLPPLSPGAGGPCHTTSPRFPLRLPYLSVSWRLLPRDREMERKKPWTAGTVYIKRVFDRSCWDTHASGPRLPQPPQPCRQGVCVLLPTALRQLVLRGKSRHNGDAVTECGIQDGAGSGGLTSGPGRASNGEQRAT